MAAPRGRAAVAVELLVNTNPELSVIVPLLNEEALVQSFLSETLSRLPADSELILVDGGSTDRSYEIAQLQLPCDSRLNLIKGPRGRSLQMNQGAQLARGKYLLFLHVDTSLPTDFAASFSVWQESMPDWGFAKVRLQGSELWCRIIGASINLRTRITQGASGDQGQVVLAQAFKAINGFRDIALMEDIDLSYRLAKNYRVKRLPFTLSTSSRRWREKGPMRTVLLMWYLRMSFLLGASPDRLATIYGGKPS